MNVSALQHEIKDQRRDVRYWQKLADRETKQLAKLEAKLLEAQRAEAAAQRAAKQIAKATKQQAFDMLRGSSAKRLAAAKRYLQTLPVYGLSGRRYYIDRIPRGTSIKLAGADTREARAVLAKLADRTTSRKVHPFYRRRGVPVVVRYIFHVNGKEAK